MTHDQMIKLTIGAKVQQVDTASDGAGLTLRFDNGVELELFDAGEREWSIRLRPQG